MESTTGYDQLMINENTVNGFGEIFIRSIDEDTPRPDASSIYSDWGEMAPEIQDLLMLRWIIELNRSDGQAVAVGDMSAHAVWYGPTITSKALNIGISLVEEYRGLGIGSIAQRLLATELHDKGFVRVEAQTDVENIAEQKSLKKAGFIFEGVARKSQGRADGLHDLQVWSHISE